MSSRWAPCDLALERVVGGGQDERPELGVVAVVRAGVVLEHVDRRIADAADRPPVPAPPKWTIRSGPRCGRSR